MHEDRFREPTRLRTRNSTAPEIGFEPEPRWQRRRERSWVGSVVKGAALVGLGAFCAVAVLLFFSPGPGQLFGLLSRDSVATAPIISQTNQIALQAQQWGITRCIESIAGLSEFLTRNAEYSWRAQRGQTDPDGEVFSAAVAAREQGSGLHGLSNMFAAPVGSGRCNAGYQSTIYVPDTCARTREVMFPTFSTPIQFGGIASAFSTPDGQAALYLLPADDAGCVAVKSELFY